MPATEPRVHGFKPGRERWILRAIKISSTTSFEREDKPLVVVDIRHIKDPYYCKRNYS
jgi:hypothetical protein